MNRIVIKVNAKGQVEGVLSDAPTRVFFVCEERPEQRVYEATSPNFVKTGPEHVHQALRDDPIHARPEAGGRPAARPGLTLVKE